MTATVGSELNEKALVKLAQLFVWRYKLIIGTKCTLLCEMSIFNGESKTVWLYHNIISDIISQQKRLKCHKNDFMQARNDLDQKTKS
jgi:hypothetical protein